MDDMYLGKPHTSSNIAWHRPQSATSLQEEELMQQSARALLHATDPLEKLRLLCLSRGASGIMVLGRIFRRLDDNGRRKLNKREFLHGIDVTGLELSKEDAEDLFDRFDKEKIGAISVDDFLTHIRPTMSESRRHVVEQVFKKLDKTGEGAITIGDIRRVYAVTSHPRYMSGEETAELVMGRFLATFEIAATVDGMVTLEEFMDYYSGLSVSIDTDSFFDLMMRQSYKL